MKLAGVIAWGELPFAPDLSSHSCIRTAAPYADFDRMVWISRLTGLLILADDLVNAGDYSTEKIAGFKHVAAGDGVSTPLNHNISDIELKSAIFHSLYTPETKRRSRMMQRCKK